MSGKPEVIAQVVFQEAVGAVEFVLPDELKPLVRAAKSGDIETVKREAIQILIYISPPTVKGTLRAFKPPLVAALDGNARQFQETFVTALDGLNINGKKLLHPPPLRDIVLGMAKMELDSPQALKVAFQKFVVYCVPDDYKELAKATFSGDMARLGDGVRETIEQYLKKNYPEKDPIQLIPPVLKVVFKSSLELWKSANGDIKQLLNSDKEKLHMVAHHLMQDTVEEVKKLLPPDLQPFLAIVSELALKESMSAEISQTSSFLALEQRAIGTQMIVADVAKQTRDGARAAANKVREIAETGVLRLKKIFKGVARKAASWIWQSTLMQVWQASVEKIVRYGKKALAIFKSNPAANLESFAVIEFLVGGDQESSELIRKAIVAAFAGDVRALLRIAMEKGWVNESKAKAFFEIMEAVQKFEQQQLELQRAALHEGENLEERLMDLKKELFETLKNIIFTPERLEELGNELDQLKAFIEELGKPGSSIYTMANPKRLLDLIEEQDLRQSESTQSEREKIAGAVETLGKQLAEFAINFDLRGMQVKIIELIQNVQIPAHEEDSPDDVDTLDTFARLLHKNSAVQEVLTKAKEIIELLPDANSMDGALDMDKLNPLRDFAAETLQQKFPNVEWAPIVELLFEVFDQNKSDSFENKSQRLVEALVHGVVDRIPQISKLLSDDLRSQLPSLLSKILIKALTGKIASEYDEIKESVKQLSVKIFTQQLDNFFKQAPEPTASVAKRLREPIEQLFNVVIDNLHTGDVKIILARALKETLRIVANQPEVGQFVRGVITTIHKFIWVQAC